MGLDDRDWYREVQRQRLEREVDVHYDPKQFRRPRAQREQSQGYVHPALRHLHKPRKTSNAMIALAWIGVVAFLYAIFTAAGHFKP